MKADVSDDDRLLVPRALAQMLEKTAEMLPGRQRERDLRAIMRGLVAVYGRTQVEQWLEAARAR